MNQGEENLKSTNEKLEAAENKLLSIDQAFDRVKRLKATEEVELKRLGDFKADVEASFNLLNGKKDRLLMEIKAIEDRKTDVLRETGILENKLKELQFEVESQQKNHIEREKSLKNKEISVITREARVAEREQNVDFLTRSVTEKHEKIKNFKESL